MRSKISVVITSFNEEHKIARALSSALWADEIIVVDGFSQDRTPQIIRQFPARLIQIPNDPGMMSMRNYGIKEARGDWIFILDADEVIPPSLAEKIKKILINDPVPYVAFRFPRQQYFFSRWVKCCTWYPDYQIRLFRKGFGFYPNQHIHEQIKIEGPIGLINLPFQHFPYRNWEEFKRKLQRNINFEVNKLIEKNYPPQRALLDLYWRPGARFLSLFFRHRGILGGWRGLILSLAAVYHELAIYSLYLKKKII